MFESRFVETSNTAKVTTYGHGSPRIVQALFSLFLLAALLPSTAVAQTNLGTFNVGSSSAGGSVTVPVSTAGTLGTISVGMQGNPILDYTETSGGTCTINQAYAAGTLCTVNVIFAPKFSGPRYGAVVLSDTSGKTMGTEFLQGTGNGPQTAFMPQTLGMLNVSGAVYTGTTVVPDGLAVDSSENLYVANEGFCNLGCSVYKLTPVAPGSSNYTATSIDATLNNPLVVAVDGAGNVFATSGGAWSATVPQVFLYTLLPSGGYAPAVSIGTFVDPLNSTPGGVAVDGAGNIYIVDQGNPSATPTAVLGSVYKLTLQPDGTYLQTTIASGLNQPWSAAVDGSGNVYFATADPAVIKLTPSGTTYTQSTIALTGLGYPNGVKVDGNGNLYLADYGVVAKLTLQSDGTYIQSNLVGPSATLNALDVAVDSSGNLFVGDGSGNIYEESYAMPPALSFATTAYSSTSSDSPQLVTVENIGNQSLNFSVLTYAADFPEYTLVPPLNDCTSSSHVAANGSCTLTVEFKPFTPESTSPFLLSENIALTTNSLNTTTAQPVLASGTEIVTEQTITFTPIPSPVFTGVAPIQLTATGGASGNPVLFSVLSGPGYVNGLNQLVITGPGTVVVAANQTYTTGYSAAPQVTQTVLVLPAVDIAGETPLGSVNIGSSIGAPVSITFATAATLENIAVLTQGTANLDFTNAGGSGSCLIEHAYAAHASCTVFVNFTPIASGPRYGAVILSDLSGNILNTGYLQGTGVGPQTNFSPQTPVLASVNIANTGGNQYIDIDGLAVDANGNLYLADEAFNNRHNNYNSSYIYKLTPTAPGSSSYNASLVNANNGIDNPLNVTLDGAGNVYATSGGDWNGLAPQVFIFALLPGGTYAPGVSIGTFDPVNSTPAGVAVDGAGNVFITDQGNGANNVYGSIYKLTLSNGNYTQTTIASGAIVGHPWSAAVDASGNVYFGSDAPAIYKLTPQGGGVYTQSSIGTGWSSPNGVKVDGNGNVYVADSGSNRVVKLTLMPGNTYVQSTLVASSAGMSPLDVAVDGNGNLFVADGSTNNIQELPYAKPSGPLSFANTPEYQISSDSPRTVTVTNFGNANLVLSALSYAADFTEAAGVGTDCSTSTNVVANGACTLSINFAPTQLVSPLNETVTLISNNLNAPPDLQLIQVRGNVLPALLTQIIIFTDNLPASVNYTAGLAYTISATGGGSGNPVTFTVTGPGTLTGSTLAVTGSGTIVVTANQAGNATYAAAPPVTQTLVVNPAVNLPTAQTITFNDNLPAVVAYNSNLTFPISAIGGGSGNPVTFTVTGPGTLSNGVLTVTGAGTIVIAANQAGNSTFAAAAQTSQSLIVTALGTATVPIFSLAAGTYHTAQTVSLSDATPGAVIYYTTNGVTTPSSSSTLYTGTGIPVSSTTTIQAIAIAPGYFKSGVASATYAINSSSADFTITATGATGGVLAPGGSLPFSFLIAPANGATTIANAVSFSVTGLPAWVSSTPVSTLAAGSTGATVNLAIRWPLTSAAKHPAGKDGLLASRLAPFSLALLLLPLVGRLRNAGKRLSRTISMLLLLIVGLAAMAGLSGCGSEVNFHGHAPQTYAVNVNATSGGYTQTYILTLAVE